MSTPDDLARRYHEAAATLLEEHIAAWSAMMEERLVADMEDDRLRDVARTIVAFSADIVRFTMSECGPNGAEAAKTIIAALQCILTGVVKMDNGTPVETVLAEMARADENARQKGFGSAGGEVPDLIASLFFGAN